MEEKIIIPFGEECYTCQSIDLKFSKNSHRKCAFPFDYVGHTYIENIYDNIFDLINSDYNFRLNDYSKKKFDDKYFLCHNKYNFKYWHDITTYSNFTNEEFNNFIEKYNRRYERLKYYLKNSKNIIILSVNHFDNIRNKHFKQSQVYKLFDLLKTYNENIQFIAINFGEEIYNKPDLKFINLQVDYDLPFTDSKEKFTKNLYEFIMSTF